MVADRAQLHTLEGLAGAVVLVLAVTYAFNAFVVTPTSGVNPGADVNQKVAQDLLEASSSNGDLKEAVLNWNTTERGFNNSTAGTYYYDGEDPDPDHLPFGNYTRSIFTERGLSYNIDIRYSKENGTGAMSFVDNGEPGSSAVTATQSIILNDDDNVTSSSGKVAINDTEKYPIPKDGEGIYNRLEVSITVW